MGSIDRPIRVAGEQPQQPAVPIAQGKAGLLLQVESRPTTSPRESEGGMNTPNRTENIVTPKGLARKFVERAEDIAASNPLKPEDLPYHSTNPQLAEYVAGHSRTVHDYTGNPIGLITVQERGRMTLQLFTDGEQMPTLYFTDPAAFPTIDSLQIGTSPYANPYGEGTILYPVDIETLEEVLPVAPILAERFSADALGIPPLQDIQDIAPGILDTASFFDVAGHILEAVIPDREALEVSTDFFDSSTTDGSTIEKTPDVPHFALALYLHGLEREALIWCDEALQTTTVLFEEKKGEKDKETLQLSYNADSFTVTHMTPNGPETTRITPELFEDRLNREDPLYRGDPSYWKAVLDRIGRLVSSAEDVWRMVLVRDPFLVRDSAKVQLDGLFADLAELIRKKGDVPHIATYLGRNPSNLQQSRPRSLIVDHPLDAGPHVWIQTGANADVLTADGKRKRVSLGRPLYAPSDMELQEQYPPHSFLGELARQAQRDEIALDETDVHAIIRPGERGMSAQGLVDPGVFPSYLVEPISAPAASDKSDETVTPFAVQLADGGQGETSHQAVEGEQKTATAVPAAPTPIALLHGVRTGNDSIQAPKGLLEELGFLQKGEREEASTAITPVPTQAAERPVRRQIRQTPPSIAEGTKGAKAKGGNNGSSRGKTTEKGQTPPKTRGKSRGTATKGRSSQKPESRQPQRGRTSPSSRSTTRNKNK